MKGEVYGYVKPLPEGKDVDRQMIALWDFGVAPENVFVEKQPLDNVADQAYQEVLKVLKEGDTLVVTNFDVLESDCYKLMDRWRYLTIAKKAGVIVLELPIANTGMEEDELGKVVARITLGIMQHFDQSRQYKKRKQAEGIAQARRNGVRLGRKPREIPKEFESVRLRWDRGELSARSAADVLGVDPNTFLKWARTETRDKDKSAT